MATAETLSLSQYHIQLSVLLHLSCNNFVKIAEIIAKNADMCACAFSCPITTLSRSASAAGTVILQGFDMYKITGGASGALRQEFRELEMLDDITMLHYNRKLPSSVVGVCRNDLISAFHLLKGVKYVPLNVHKAIRWKENDLFHLMEGTNIAWRIVDPSDKPKPGPSAGSEKKSITHIVEADGNSGTPLIGKQKLGADFESETRETASKKIRLGSKVTTERCVPSNLSKASLNTTEHRVAIGTNPRGLQWSNNSCAFDAVLSILYNVWQDNATERTVQFKNINIEYLGQIADGFSQTRLRDSVYTLEEVRDFMRRSLERADPAVFPWGGYTGIQYILDYLLVTGRSVTSSSVRCPNDHPLNAADLVASSCQIAVLCQSPNIQAFINDQSVECTSRCRVCHSHIVRRHVFEDTPAVIVFDLSQHPISLLESVVITTVNGNRTTYKLRGVMYYLNNHFTSRIISETGHVWYHDGISTGRQTVPEGSIGDTELGMCRSGTAICAVYVTPC